MKKGHRIAREVKEQILGRIKSEGLAVSEVAKEHGVSEQTVYNWLGAGVEGKPTYGIMGSVTINRKICRLI